MAGDHTARAALLILADGRFPAGGHAHSGGAEAAVRDGRIHDPVTLARFCRTRLHTAGLVAAALAAAAASVSPAAATRDELAPPGAVPPLRPRPGPTPAMPAAPDEPGSGAVPLRGGPGPGAAAPDGSGREGVGPAGPGGLGPEGAVVPDGFGSGDRVSAVGGGFCPGVAVCVAPDGSGREGVGPAGPGGLGPEGAVGGGVGLLVLDDAADARIPSVALRTVSRRLGRQLMRAARAAWPHPALDGLAAARPRGAHQPVVLGVTARAAGLRPVDAAYAAAYESVSGPVAAAVRLLGLDPFHAASVLARLAPEIDAVSRAAADAAERARTQGAQVLPAASAPVMDIAAEHHAAWPVRLFAS